MLTKESLNFLVLIFPVLLLSVAVHEFAHCWATDRLGDTTPRNAGRLTLNPLAHLDPLGTLMMIASALAGFGFGWGKPSPFNPYHLRNVSRDRMLLALAGPFSNLLQMLVWAAIGQLVVGIAGLVAMTDAVYGFLWLLCYYGVVVNGVLAAFNLLPVYPLDGHHILGFFLPRSWQPVIDHPAWGYLFLLLVFSGQAGVVIEPLLKAAMSVAYVVVGFPSPQGGM
jgi:Zn-dependent protease